MASDHASGATPSLRVRARRRAVGLRGLVYFVRTHTRSTVPRGRSAAALGGDGTVAKILLLLRSNRMGKGLKSSLAFRKPAVGVAARRRISRLSRRLTLPLSCRLGRKISRYRNIAPANAYPRFGYIFIFFQLPAPVLGWGYRPPLPASYSGLPSRVSLVLVTSRPRVRSCS